MFVIRDALHIEINLIKLNLPLDPIQFDLQNSFYNKSTINKIIPTLQKGKFAQQTIPKHTK